MYAVGTFFERFGGMTTIDVVVTQEQIELAFMEEEAMTDEQYKKSTNEPFNSWLVLTEVRMHFDDKLNKLIKKAAKGKAIVIDGEETLFAIAGTKKEAKDAFIKAYAKEALNEIDLDD